MILTNKQNRILLVSIFLFCLSLIFVFCIRNNLKNIDKEIIRTNYEIDKEKDFIKILKADYANLVKPSRIENIAKETLGLGYIQSSQIKKFSDLKK